MVLSMSIKLPLKRIYNKTICNLVFYMSVRFVSSCLSGQFLARKRAYFLVEICGRGCCISQNSEPFLHVFTTFCPICSLTQCSSNVFFLLHMYSCWPPEVHRHTAVLCCTQKHLQFFWGCVCCCTLTSSFVSSLRSPKLILAVTRLSWLL